MIIKATSHTIKTVWIAIFFMFLVFIFSFYLLKNGIHLASITTPVVKIEELYIKLDKKLIVNAQRIWISQSKQKEPSLEESAWVIEHYPLLHQLFERISIHSLSYEDLSFSMHFENDTFLLQNEEGKVHVQFFPTDRYHFEMHLLEATIKPLHLQLSAKASINLQKDSYQIEGAYETFDIKGNFSATIDKTLLSYSIQADPFSNHALGELVTFIASKTELEPLAKAWIHENIVASFYQLHFLEGRFDLQTQDYFPLEIRGSATVKDANVTFAPEAPHAHVEEIGLIFENDKLFFDVMNASYQGKSVEKADVFIYNLLGKGTGIRVDLNASSRLDDEIHKILHAFNIMIPITQYSGTTEAHLTLDIKFLPYDINATGEFSVHESDFLLDNVPMTSNFAKIHLDNRMVYLEETHMHYNNLFNIRANGLFDTYKSSFNGSIDIDNLDVRFGDIELLRMKNLPKQSATLQISETHTRLDLPQLQSTLHFAKNNNTITCNDTSLLLPYSPFMNDMNLSKGSVEVKTKDFAFFDASVLLEELSLPLMQKDKPVQSLDITLHTDGKTLFAKTKDDALSLSYNKGITLHVKNYDLILPEETKTQPLSVPISIIGEHSNLHLKAQKKLLSDNYTLKKENNETSLSLTHQKASFAYNEDEKRLHVKADKMDEHFTNALIGAYPFRGGAFALRLEGISDQAFKARFDMNDTAIKELKFFDNLMATINAVPSLIFFSNPNFNQEGYVVKKGFVEFSKNNSEVLSIDSVSLEGNNADIVGSGTFNQENSALSLDLRIRTLKPISSIIDTLPLVGGLILGEDKRLSTRISVSGTLDDPKIETHLVSDTLMTPLNILKRTLELPLELFKSGDENAQ